MSEPYQLYYWPHIPGRGEFVRMVLEDAAIPYRDVARAAQESGGGNRAVASWLFGNHAQAAVFAPPVLVVGDLVLSQTAVICRFLGERHALAPRDEPGRFVVQQHMLTILDLASEAHDTHHPLGAALYYEDQKGAAKQRASLFLKDRLPKFTRYFETVLERSEGDHLLGSQFTYADLGLFHLLDGLRYAFPRGFARSTARTPALLAFRDRIEKRPNIAAYMNSDRYLGFNEQGLFRHYRELDDDAN